MINARIAGVGHYLPDQIVPNDELVSRLAVDSRWIEERTGIRERRYARSGEETATTMGAAAARIAIDRAGITPNDLDFIIFATMSADYLIPGCGVLLQRELGITQREIGALDVRNQCTGFLYALSVANAFVKTGTYRNVLVVGAERQSCNLDYSVEGRDVAVLFADGAGAVVVQPDNRPDRGILSVHLHADGTYAEELSIINPGSHGNYHFNKYKPHYLNGNFVKANPGPFEPPYLFTGVFKGLVVVKKAFEKFPAAINEALVANGLIVDDINHFVLHQANLRILEYVQRGMNLPAEKVRTNIQQYGNTTAASIPIILSELWELNSIQSEQLVCLVAFGSGFTWASALIRW